MFQVDTKRPGEIVHMVLKPAQRRLVTQIDTCWGQGRAAFILNLKARQLGKSTGMQLLQVEGLVRWAGMFGMTISYEVDQVEFLGKKAGFFLRQIPEACRAPVTQWSTQHIELMHTGEDGTMRASTLDVRTAKNVNVGRGFTVHRAHLSEPTFYEDAGALLGIRGSIPDEPGCYGVFEFTANGYEAVYRMWEASKRGENDFIRMFDSWLDEPEYYIEPARGEAISLDTPRDEYERDMLENYGATPGQIKWWRWAVRNKCDGHVPSALQEFPYSEHVAFQSTGRPVFPIPILISWKDAAKARTVKRGRLIRETLKTPDGRSTTKVFFLEDAGGWLSVYEEPTGGEVYGWGADTATGAESDPDNKKSDTDYSDCPVLNKRTLRTAAVIHYRQDIDIYTEHVHLLSEWYGMAWGHVENNGVGQAFLTAARMLKFLRILYRTRLEPTEEGDTSPEARPGFNMNTKTKPAVILRLQKMVRDLGMFNEWKPPKEYPNARPVCPFTIEQIEEMIVFQRDAMGRQKAPPGQHDDRVMGLCLAVQACEDLDLEREVSAVVDASNLAEVMQQALALPADEEAEESVARANAAVEEFWRTQTWETPPSP